MVRPLHYLNICAMETPFPAPYDTKRCFFLTLYGIYVNDGAGMSAYCIPIFCLAIDYFLNDSVIPS